ncbi:MAG: DUF6421 family protein [Pseudomonadota bacterium]
MTAAPSTAKILADFAEIREVLSLGADASHPKVSNFLKKHTFHPMVGKFSHGLQTNDFGNVRDYDSEDKADLILARFSAAYSPILNYDGLLLEQTKVNSTIPILFPSRAKPAFLIAHTVGFEGNRAVALFPENFVTSKHVHQSSSVFYFINKFVERFRKITLPFIQSARVNQSTFADILHLSDAQIAEVSSVWVHLHEHFHNQGPLPLPHWLPIKSSKSVAALEELRVDLLTILHAHKSISKIDSLLGRRVSQFVLAERALRYPIECHPENDYDARSSILFLNMLRTRRAVNWSEGTITFKNEKLMRAILDISQEIEALELKVSHQPKTIGYLKDFVKANCLATGNGNFQNLKVFGERRLDG